MKSYQTLKMAFHALRQNIMTRRADNPGHHYWGGIGDHDDGDRRRASLAIQRTMSAMAPTP